MESENNNGFQKHKKKKSKVRWGKLILFIIVVVLIGVLLGYICNSLYNLFVVKKKDTVITKPDKLVLSEEKLNEKINVLLLGIDDGDNEFPDAPKRTDAMLVASFNPNKKEVAILSLPRDTMVQIPNRPGMDKINHAYAYGGATLARRTVANTLNIPIHYYMMIDWKAFIKVMDILGGVNLYVEKDMKYEDPYADLKIDIKQGYQYLNGEQSAKYIRFRTDELGDIGRVQRQQRFLKALAEQHISLNTIGKLPDIVNTLDTYIQTDMSVLVLAKVLNSFKSLNTAEIKTDMLPGDFATVKGVSYWKINEQELGECLKKLDLQYYPPTANSVPTPQKQ